MKHEAASEDIWRHPAAPWLVWTGLAVAFSPVLVELATHLVGHPWARTALVFPVLAWVAARSATGPTPAVSRGVLWSCFGVALGIELLAVGGDVVRLARAALPIAGVGAVWGAGWARGTAAFVLLWAVPLPSALLALASPGLEEAWGRVVAGALPGVGFAQSGDTPTLLVGGLGLALTPADGGLALGYGLAGLGWFRAAVVGSTPAAAAAAALRWGALLVPIQLVLLAAASALVWAARDVARARFVLDQSGWLLVVGLGALLAGRALQDTAEGRAGGERIGEGPR